MVSKLILIKKSLTPGKPGKLVLKRTLSNKDADSLVMSMRDIEAFAQHYLVYECAMINYDSFISADSALIEKFKHYGNNPGENLFGEFSRDLNLTLLNFLTSVKLMLEYLEKSLSNKYGKGSEEFQRCKSVQNGHYDDKFSYRFMYELRNYMQHSGLPPINYEATKEFGMRDGKPGFLANMHVGFNRTALLQNSYKWKAVVKNEMEAMTGDIPAPTYMHEYMIAAQDIFLRSTDRALYRRALNAKQALLTALNKPDFYYKDEHIIVADDGTTTDIMSLPLVRLSASLLGKLDQFTGQLRQNGIDD
ncbi:hypothetical protein ACVLVH_004531 [Kluyvera sp. 1366]